MNNLPNTRTKHNLLITTLKISLCEEDERQKAFSKHVNWLKNSPGPAVRVISNLEGIIAKPTDYKVLADQFQYGLMLNYGFTQATRFFIEMFPYAKKPERKMVFFKPIVHWLDADDYYEIMTVRLSELKRIAVNNDNYDRYGLVSVKSDIFRAGIKTRADEEMAIPVGCRDQQLIEESAIIKKTYGVKDES